MAVKWSKTAKNDKWIGRAMKNAHGQFSAKAKAAGMSTLAYANRILANTKAYPLKLVRQAVAARNAIRASRG